jgi:hypothetical protein
MIWPTTPQPKADEGCGVVGQIIMVIVVVVVAYFTAGAAATALQGLGGAFAAGGTATVGGVAGLSVTTAVTAGAIGGAVGSLAGQLAGVAIGAQADINWNGVALGALGGGITAGLSGSLTVAGSPTASVAVRAAVSNAMTQGIAVATGLQDQFNWTGVAASAVGAGVGSAVGGAVGESMNGALGNATAEKLVTGTLAGLASGSTVALMRGGRVSIQQIAADAFGNALGSSLAGASTSGGSGYDYSNAPDESAAESARLDRSGNRYAAWPDQADAETARLARQGDPDAYWPDQTVAESATLGRYETKARFLENASKVWAAEDAASAKAALAQQHRGADAYRREVDEATQRAKWNAMQVGAWSGRTGTGGPVWHVDASADASPVTSNYVGDMSTGAPYDEFGLFTMPGSQPIWNTIVNSVAGSVGSIGPAMQEFKYGALESIRIDTELAAQGRDTSALYGNALKGAVIETMLPGSPQEAVLGVGAGLVAGKVVGVVSGALVSKFPVLGMSVGDAVDAGVARTARAFNPTAPDMAVALGDPVQAVMARRAVARSFYEGTGWSSERIEGHLGGIDFTQPVEVVTLPQGTMVNQHQISGQRVGGYFAPVDVSPDTLGIDAAGRVPSLFVTTSDVQVLRSTAADILDWNGSGRIFRGGGTQYFAPDNVGLARVPHQ